MRDGLGDDGVAIRCQPAIGRQRQHRCAGFRFDPSRGLAQRLFAARGDSNFRTFGGERPRNAVADALAGAADNRDPVFQVSGHG